MMPIWNSKYIPMGYINPMAYDHFLEVLYTSRTEVRRSDITISLPKTKAHPKQKLIMQLLHWKIQIPNHIQGNHGKDEGLSVKLSPRMLAIYTLLAKAKT
jgi:hypothetical protein